MNHEDIISDFESLNREFLEFNNQISFDDYCFYDIAIYYGSFKSFNIQLEDLCSKYFECNWGELKTYLFNKYQNACEKKKNNLKKNYFELFVFFFNEKLSYEKKYEIEYEYYPDDDPRRYGEPFLHGASVPKSEKIVWTGKYEVISHKNQNVEVKTFWDITKPNRENLLLKNWKKVIASFLNENWESFSGNFNKTGSINKHYKRYGFEERKISITDYSCFLALKNAIRFSLYVTTFEKEFLISISSGIAAKIAIRKKGKFMMDFLSDEKQIYSMTNFSHEENQDYYFEEKTILTISGYSDSKVNMPIPNGYYFVGETYIVEVEFIAAPILLNNAVFPIMGTADYSSDDSRYEDEEEEEEERRRLWDDD